MARKRMTIEKGSGNVFADLGYPDAKERTLKVQLAMEVNRLLGERGLTQAECARAWHPAAARLGPDALPAGPVLRRAPDEFPDRTRQGRRDPDPAASGAPQPLRDPRAARTVVRRLNAPESLQAARWLEGFAGSLARGSIRDAVDLFAPGCYWRDLLAFTWDIHTHEGREEIRRMLAASLAQTKPAKWRQANHPVSGPDEAWFMFETAAGRGVGHLRLREGRAWTLLTALRELHGHPKKPENASPTWASQDSRTSSSSSAAGRAASRSVRA